MEYILQDFTNRTELLAYLWEMLRQEVDARILVLESEAGMGKTYLLNEFRAECQEENTGVVWLDFRERYEDPGYMYIVEQIWTQLGPAGFETLMQTIQDVACHSERAQGRESPFSPEQEWPSNGTRPGPESPAGRSRGATEGATGGAIGGVTISGGTNTFRDVAGRDIIYYIYQEIQRDAPYVQEWATARITEALKACMMRITSERRVVFLVDHWQRADGMTRQWLCRSLVKWLADDVLPRAMLVIAGTEGIELDPRRRIKRRPLSSLAEGDVFTYWVMKCGLPQEDVPEVWKYTGGVPQILKMIAAYRARVKPT